MSHTDPGEQARTRKRVPPPSDSGQGDLLGPPAAMPDLGRFNCAGEYKPGDAMRADIDRENESMAAHVAAAGAVLAPPSTPAKIAYYCMDCPATFRDGPTSNAHYDATGHRQHWLAERAYKSSARLGAPAPEQPRSPSAGLVRKARELANHERGHEDRLEFIREKLKALYQERKLASFNVYEQPPQGARVAYVTADDAAKILEAASNLGYLDDDERRNWFGALFREKGWRWVDPKLVPSLRKEMNGRMQRTWAWEPDR